MKAPVQKMQHKNGAPDSGRRSLLARFLFPRMNGRYLLRVAVVAAAAFVFFRFVCMPLHISGSSMEPTYHDSSVNLGYLWGYRTREPQRHDVVMVRLAGNRVMYLKRVVAFPGEKVAFSEGRLLVNDQPLDEPYVELPCRWTLAPTWVDQGHLYVVGDNRSMPPESHVMGQIARERIVGRPLW